MARRVDAELRVSLPAALCAAILCAAACALLAACSPPPEPANPALWRVTAPDGGANDHRGWLFGTIHALRKPVAWRTPKVAAALADSGELAVEIAALNDDGATARAFHSLAQASDEPPLSQRVPPADRPALAALLARAGLSEGAFATTKTWAAALTLAQVGENNDEIGNGIDRALIATTRRPLTEFEGAAPQLALFDALPEASQRVLLDEAVTGAATADADTRRLASAWKHGDMAAIADEADRGLLRDPALREALFTARNHRWVGLIERDLAAGKRPFVAVGAAHMLGPDGLVALLQADGWRVTRVE